jgi:hypothetical protein
MCLLYHSLNLLDEWSDSASDSVHESIAISNLGGNEELEGRQTLVDDAGTGEEVKQYA